MAISKKDRSMKFETKAIHVGEAPNLEQGGYGDAVMPIHLSSTFARKLVDVPTQGYEYSRTGNPTRHALEQRLASLENAKYGLAFASGLAAETTLILSLLHPGDHIIAFDDLYGGTRRLLSQVFSQNYGIHCSYVDARKVKNVQDEITSQTKLIWLETPSNPLLKLCDIQAISDIAKKKNIITLVDNTFLSPYFQTPLDLGADIVLHSTTKYINGHSDSVGGCIMTNHAEHYEKLKFHQNAVGAILSPFDSYLVLRGTKTLAVRMKQHQENAMKISEYLESHSKIKRVYYPGLKSHPDYALALKQMKGFGGMISFELATDLANTKKFVESLTYPLIAESLGGVESLIEIPALMTHAGIRKEDREHIGLSDSLIRLSVGLENVEDLIADISDALDNTSCE